MPTSHRILFMLLLVFALAGCATGTARNVPIEDRQPVSAAHTPTAAAVKRAPDAKSDTPVGEPKVFALPDSRVEPSALPPPTTRAAPLEQSEQPNPAAVSTPAVHELLAKADAATLRGDSGGARAILERALKIKTDDAQVWYRLAELNFDEGEYEQAIVAADRCRGLAGGDRTLIARAVDMISRARRALSQP
jgi:Tetratricopeptide repeat